MSEVAGAEIVGGGPSPTSGQPITSAVALPVRQRDDHARPGRVAGCCSPSTPIEGDDYVSEWDPRLT